VPASLSELSPAWLTEALRESGILPNGTVSSVSLTPITKWNVASVSRIELGYDSSTPPHAPASMFAKLRAEPDPLADVFPGEVAFYRSCRQAGLPVPDCYVAINDDHAGRSLLLLEDLSESHEVLFWPEIPPLQRVHLALGSLACVHAHYWLEHPSSVRLEADKLNAQIPRIEAELEPHIGEFLAAMSTQGKAGELRLFERLYPQLRTIKLQRAMRWCPLTRVHGDPHFWNILFPRNPESPDCRLFDWEDWRYDNAGSDVALVVHIFTGDSFDAEVRDSLLQHHHTALSTALGSVLDWQNYLDDIRYGHLQNLVVPVFQHLMGRDAEACANTLTCWARGFQELGAAALTE